MWYTAIIPAPSRRPICGYGGIGRHDGFRFHWATVQVQVLLPAPRRSKLCIACSDLFYKSERAHAAAPPFQTATAMLGCGLGPPLRGSFVFSWKISILTVHSRIKGNCENSCLLFWVPPPGGRLHPLGFQCSGRQSRPSAKVLAGRARFLSAVLPRKIAYPPQRKST